MLASVWTPSRTVRIQNTKPLGGIALKCINNEALVLECLRGNAESCYFRDKVCNTSPQWNIGATFLAGATKRRNAVRRGRVDLYLYWYRVFHYFKRCKIHDVVLEFLSVPRHATNLCHVAWWRHHV
jgi:hypothetical protein